MSGGPKPRNGGQREVLEWVGEQSRCRDSVFNRELSTPGFFQTLCLVALLSSHLPALWLVFAVD